MRIGIYGGSFSPVHNGHVAAAKAFMEQMWLDVLYIMPAGIPPHKQMEGDANTWQRLRMCELAFEGVEGVLISDLEIRREGKSYTVDTLRELSAPDRRLFLLIFRNFGNDTRVEDGLRPFPSHIDGIAQTEDLLRLTPRIKRKQHIRSHQKKQSMLL